MTVLESIGFTGIRYDAGKHTMRFAREAGTNPTSVVLNCSNLFYKCFSTRARGTLFTLVMDKRRCSFPDALRYVCKVSGLDKRSFEKPYQYPFGGFYKTILRTKMYPEESLTTYPSSVLDEFDIGNSFSFLQDGIDLRTQELFGVGYDITTHRTTIPEYSFDGQLVGVMGRSNDPSCPHEERWLPIIPTKRSLTLYGYHVNYQSILQKRTVILGESEKFVMQAKSFGSHVALATCGCHISDTQARYLKALRPHKIILAYDESLEEDILREEAAKLVTLNNPLLNCKVGYIFDKSNEIIPKGSKQNAADMGRDAYRELIQTKTIYLN